MLTPWLRDIKDRLEKKFELCDEGKELLSELQILEEILELHKTEIGEKFDISLKIVSPPPEICPCCGQKL